MIIWWRPRSSGGGQDHLGGAIHDGWHPYKLAHRSTRWSVDHLVALHFDESELEIGSRRELAHCTFLFPWQFLSRQNVIRFILHLDSFEIRYDQTRYSILVFIDFSILRFYVALTSMPLSRDDFWMAFVLESGVLTLDIRVVLGST